MKKEAWAGVLTLLILGLLVAVLAFTSGGHNHAKGDTDKASDCWVHPDHLGRRHCAS